MDETGNEADSRRLAVFDSPNGDAVVPRALRGYVRDLILADLQDRRRRRLGHVRDDLIEFLDSLSSTSVIGSSHLPASKIISGKTVDAVPVVFLSVARVADRLGCSSRYVTDLLNSGRLLGSKSGRQWIVLEADLDRYMSGEVA